MIYYACETTVFLNGKYSNTTYISKIWPESKKSRVLIKTPEPQIKQNKPRSSEKKLAVATLVYTMRQSPQVSMDKITIGYSAGYLWFFWNRIAFGYLFLKKIGSRQDQDICLISIMKFSWEWFKTTQMMVLMFSLLWFLHSQKIKLILSVCTALITPVTGFLGTWSL